MLRPAGGHGHKHASMPALHLREGPVRKEAVLSCLQIGDTEAQSGYRGGAEAPLAALRSWLLTSLLAFALQWVLGGQPAGA